MSMVTLEELELGEKLKTATKTHPAKLCVSLSHKTQIEQIKLCGCNTTG